MVMLAVLISFLHCTAYHTRVNVKFPDSTVGCHSVHRYTDVRKYIIKETLTLYPIDSMCNNYLGNRGNTVSI